MKNTGFRIDTSRLASKLKKARGRIKAELFKPDVLNYVRVTLNTCVRDTPVRQAQTIQSNQNKQYDHRVQYIPSVHELRDPTLIVKPNGEFLFMGGKWYHCNNRLPAHVWTTYQTLKAEQQRRIQTPRTKFIKDRMQARFLYQRSWTQVGNSLGLQVRASGQVTQSLTRRKPAHEPPRGYAQLRGGERVLNVLIYNPFLNTEYGPMTHVYKPFTAQDILEPAIARHRPAFLSAVNRRLHRAMYAVMHS